MGKLPVCSGREAVVAFEKLGWAMARQSGSHIDLVRGGTSVTLYDGHGSMVGQVARAEDDAPSSSFVAVSGAPAFELGARRKYDAWGQARWSEGQPAEQGYCGNLQHRRDADTGLVYMRARYYEPWTGRFLSEDPAMDGANWYVYCANDPVNRMDVNGRVFWSALGIIAFLAAIVITLMSNKLDWSIKTHIYARVSLLLLGLAMTIRGCSERATKASEEELRKLQEHNEETLDEIEKSLRSLGPGSQFARIQAAYEYRVWFYLQVLLVDYNL